MSRSALTPRQNRIQNQERLKARPFRVEIIAVYRDDSEQSYGFASDMRQARRISDRIMADPTLHHVEYVMGGN